MEVWTDGHWGIYANYDDVAEDGHDLFDWLGRRLMNCVFWKAGDLVIVAVGLLDIEGAHGAREALYTELPSSPIMATAHNRTIGHATALRDTTIA
jgi:hypothetical protein